MSDFPIITVEGLGNSGLSNIQELHGEGEGYRGRNTEWERGVRKGAGANYRPAGISNPQLSCREAMATNHLLNEVVAQNTAKRNDNQTRCEAGEWFPCMELSMVLTSDAQQPTETRATDHSTGVWGVTLWRRCCAGELGG